MSFLFVMTFGQVFNFSPEHHQHNADLISIITRHKDKGADFILLAKDLREVKDYFSAAAQTATFIPTSNIFLINDQANSIENKYKGLADFVKSHNTRCKKGQEIEPNQYSKRVFVLDSDQTYLNHVSTNGRQQSYATILVDRVKFTHVHRLRELYNGIIKIEQEKTAQAIELILKQANALSIKLGQPLLGMIHEREAFKIPLSIYGDLSEFLNKKYKFLDKTSRPDEDARSAAATLPRSIIHAVCFNQLDNVIRQEILTSYTGYLEAYPEVVRKTSQGYEIYDVKKDVEKIKAVIHEYALLVRYEIEKVKRFIMTATIKIEKVERPMNMVELYDHFNATSNTYIEKCDQLNTKIGNEEEQTRDNKAALKEERDASVNNLRSGALRQSTVYDVAPGQTMQRPLDIFDICRSQTLAQLQEAIGDQRPNMNAQDLRGKTLLDISCGRGEVEFIEFLAPLTDVNARKPAPGLPTIFSAIEGAHSFPNKAIQILLPILKAGVICDKDTLNSNRQTPLHVVTEQGDSTTLKQLLQWGCIEKPGSIDFAAENGNSRTALLETACSDNTDIKKELIKLFFDHGIIYTKTDIDFLRKSSSPTAVMALDHLIINLKEQLAEIVRIDICENTSPTQSEASPERSRPSGSWFGRIFGPTPAEQSPPARRNSSASMDSSPLINLPLPAPRLQRSGSFLGKHLSSQEKNRLDDASKASADKDETQLVSEACAEENMKYLESLTKYDFNRLDKTGLAPIHLCCITGKLTVLQFLLKKPGINLNLLSAASLTALHYAAYYAHLPLIKLLIERDVAIVKVPAPESSADQTKIPETANCTPLHFAVCSPAKDKDAVKNRLDVVTAILNYMYTSQYRPLIRQPDYKTNETAFLKASFRCDKEMMSLLIGKGVWLSYLDLNAFQSKIMKEEHGLEIKKTLCGMIAAQLERLGSSGNIKDIASPRKNGSQRSSPRTSP